MKNKIAFLAIRVSLGLVFLIFGIGKFKNDSFGIDWLWRKSKGGAR